MTIVTRVSKSVRTTSNQKKAANEDWMREMREAFRDISKLCRFLEIDESVAAISSKANLEFPIFTPRFFANKIEKRNPVDPLLLQVLPTQSELFDENEYKDDPVGDLQATLKPGLIQKYAGRALLITTGACAVHCRYCFRRHFPYEQSPNSISQWQGTLDSIRNDSTIEEVILSGGDPFTLSDAKLKNIVDLIEQIPHVSRIRVHTRLPIMIPSRITQSLLNIFVESRLSSWIVVHANHSKEICESVGESLRKFQSANMTVLNQAVLLAGINDTFQSQYDLCRSLIRYGAVPYYLHHLDPVKGAAHFETSLDRGKKIIEQLRQKLPGFAVPLFVKEIPGEPSKTLV